MMGSPLGFSHITPLNQSAFHSKSQSFKTKDCDDDLNYDTESNLHRLLVFRHENIGLRLHRAQGLGVGETL